MIFVHSDTFYICCKIQNGILYAVLQYVGPAEEAAKYQFNKGRTEGVAVIHLARCFNEDVGEVYLSGKCVKLYPEQFNRLTNEKDEVVFLMQMCKIVYNYSYEYYYRR